MSGKVYLVIVEPGGLFGAHLDRETAKLHAVPIIADYRSDGCSSRRQHVDG